MLRWRLVWPADSSIETRHLLFNYMANGTAAVQMRWADGKAAQSGNGITHWPVYGALSMPWAVASCSLQVEFQNKTWRFYIVALSYLREHGTSSDVTFRYLLNLPRHPNDISSTKSLIWENMLKFDHSKESKLNTYVMQSHACIGRK